METVVHVETIEQWKSVLDVWFAQGYEWRNGGKGYRIVLFVKQLGRHLKLNANHKISYWSMGSCGEPFIEYADFMKQQEKTMTKTTYYVTKEQLDFIEKIKSKNLPFYFLVNKELIKARNLSKNISDDLDKQILRYIGGDETIEFKVKEQLYRLWRIDDDGDRVYMEFVLGTPNWTLNKRNAFTAPREEIKKWKTPAWDIEKVD
ncbi:hypothetical protein [Leuconostoc citreum]